MTRPANSANCANYRQGRLQPARWVFDRLSPLGSALAWEHPAALKYALALLGFMQPSTRLPIVQLNDTAKAEVAHAIAGLADKDLASADDALRATPVRDRACSALPDDMP
jgi:4-hydroxy-tetrahydrodipicolinate synthase